ncbi:fumarylacetoacetate hydrolase family protein [Pseudonocardia sp. C8]|uniref:fumarylacetoacetate hydrolase family protein n=1 Tax=Pseudonocardia sp. C8 TaxID=2762759 RepID=UPI0016433090|nr:fumarylacetoacetate hydrolase family protein [Pseudonocardia sp. C8]MBC3191356.1 fumarylacetoacetate hydrolase family protein [Pseudonocardia sp. C8]
MRIGSLELAGARRYGRVTGDDLDLLAPGCDPLALLDPDRAGELAWEGRVPWDGAGRLAPPVPVSTVRDFITFEQHTAGSLRSVVGSAEVPEAWFEAPAFYFTNPHAVIGSGEDVPVPPGSELFDVELEVGIVIGRAGYNLPVDRAWDHIAGLTVLNDWSARDLQRAEMRVGLGPAKGKDTATTLGPVLVGLDELAGARRGDRYDLDMEVTVNGSRLGGDSLANMAWSFAELVSYASRGTWVRPGDVLGSGTCGGGCLAEHWGWSGDRSPAPLAVGDVVRMTVEGIGTIENRVVAGPELHPVPAARRVPWSEPPAPQLRRRPAIG